MKSSTPTIVAVMFSVFVCSQIGLAQAPTPADRQAGSPAPPKFSPGELDKLVAPVALYPDALVAHILPASTAPVDVIEAARYLKQRGGKIDTTDDKQWHPSVKVLVQFPEVLYKMEADLEWTIRLGQAVDIQLEDVMTAIQRVRNLAYAAGNLSTNEKQIIIVEKEVIVVQPATSTIYVPSYNPDVIIVKQNTAAVASVMTFAAGVVVGAALADDNCDWHGHAIYHGGYYHGGGWDNYWRRSAQLPWNPRGVADPRGLYDPRGVLDPRGRYDPRGPLDPRGRYDPRSPVATPYGAGGVGRMGVGGQAGLGGGVAGPAGIGRGPAGQAGVGGGAAGVGRPGAGGQAGIGGGAAGQAGVGGGAAGVGRPGAGGQAGIGGGAAGQAGVGGGAAGAGRAGAGGQAGAGGGAAGQAGAGRGAAGGASSSRGYGSSGSAKATSASPFAGAQGSSQTGSASDRGRQSQSGGSTPSASRSSGGRSGGSGVFSGGGGGRSGGGRRK